MFEVKDDRDYRVLVEENLFVDGIQLEIERALEGRGLTHADLAELIGVSQARVSKILSGNGTNLQARTVARIAAALGLRACVNFHEIGEPIGGWVQEDEHSITTPDDPKFAIWMEDALAAIEGASDSRNANDNHWHEAVAEAA